MRPSGPVIETVAKARDKQNWEMWNSKVYSALVQAGRVASRGLSTWALFWVSFIWRRLMGPSDFPALSSFEDTISKPVHRSRGGEQQ